MLPIKVALASRTPAVPFEDVAHVAAALTQQVSRDVTPIWGIRATVTPVANPKHVPAGYWPMYIVNQLPPGEGGFHWTKHKQPFAEIEAGDSWSLSASHELVEMLVDPSGNRLVAGPELVVHGGSIKENPNKQVEYLVEACDPCESADHAYLIGDVVVSDFFTPHYHDPVAVAGTRYSFTGALTHPRQVLKEGYISWADPESGDLMQIKFFGASPQVVNLSQGESMGTASLREFVHTKRTGHPQLSKVASGHKTLQLRATRHAAIQTTAERRAAAYERPAR